MTMGVFSPRSPNVQSQRFSLYDKTLSKDGGLTWSKPESIFARSDVHLCEPGIIRSPDGKQLCVLLRENRRRRNSLSSSPTMKVGGLNLVDCQQHSLETATRQSTQLTDGYLYPFGTQHMRHPPRVTG